jgi:hypothetical protein
MTEQEYWRARFNDESWLLRQREDLIRPIIASPAFALKPKLSIDGDKWCALHGENLQDGVAGFGDSPDEAYSDFDKNWFTKHTSQSQGG